MKKIKIKIDLYTLSFIHSEIESAYGLGHFGSGSIFYVYAIIDLSIKLSKKLQNVFLNHDKSKILKVNLRLNEFEALYKFLEESNLSEDSDEVLIFLGYLNTIKVNHI